MIDDFTRARIDSVQTKNTDLKPEDLLRYVLDEIQSGRGHFTRMMILCSTKSTEPNVSEEYQTFRANVPWSDELIMLEVARQRCLRRITSAFA